ncbi:MAG TPA: hypothetical protein VKT29_18120 [Terriglobales bacterium]|nr:hypothetical protein [Terriglobales bacterium]
MPVLIIVLSAYLFFFAVIALIAIAEYADRRERRRVAQPGIISLVSLAGMSVHQSCDPFYFAFWQAQVPALRAIHDGGHGGIHMRSLRPCFAVVCRRFPEIYDGHTLEQWLQFLQQEQLIFCNGEKVRITSQGSEFLRIQITRSATVNH